MHLRPALAERQGWPSRCRNKMANISANAMSTPVLLRQELATLTPALPPPGTAVASRDVTSRRRLLESSSRASRQKEARRIPGNDGGQVACLVSSQSQARGRSPDDIVVHRIRKRMLGPTFQTAGRRSSEKSRQGHTDKCKKHQRRAAGKVAGQGCSVAGNRLFQLFHFGDLLPFAHDRQAMRVLLNCSHS